MTQKIIFAATAAVLSAATACFAYSEPQCEAADHDRPAGAYTSAITK